MVFLFEDEGDHLRGAFAQQQQFQQHARPGQLVVGATLEHAVVAEAVLFRHHAHTLEMHLADERGEVGQGRQWLFAGVDHVAEVEQGIQPWVAHPAEQGGDLVALEFLVLFEVEVEVVLVGQPRQAPQVVFDQVHHAREVPLVTGVDADVAAADGPGHGHRLVDVFRQGAADLDMHVQLQRAGLVGEGREALGGHARKAVVLAVQQVQREAV
ncbi:hypothetical protein D9M72_294400 [compost metagenome]